jgi:AcrR family transcriptional regulator
VPKTTPESNRGNRGPALLAAARKIFFEKGYAATTVEQVARAAGLSKRSVYLYFKNKDELFIAVASEGIENLRRRLETLDIEARTVDELIQDTVDRYLAFAKEEPQLFRIIFREATAEMMRNVSAKLRAQVARQERECLGFVERIVARGIETGAIPEVDPLETAVIFWGTVTGIILLSLGGSQTVFARKNREELITKAVLMLRAGVGSLQGAAVEGP